MSVSTSGTRAGGGVRELLYFLFILMNRLNKLRRLFSNFVGFQFLKVLFQIILHNEA